MIGFNKTLWKVPWVTYTKEEHQLLKTLKMEKECEEGGRGRRGGGFSKIEVLAGLERTTQDVMRRSETDPSGCRFGTASCGGEAALQTRAVTGHRCRITGVKEDGRRMRTRRQRTNQRPDAVVWTAVKHDCFIWIVAQQMSEFRKKIIKSMFYCFYSALHK